MTNNTFSVKPEDIFVLYPEYNAGKYPLKKVLVNDEWKLMPDTLFDALDNQDVKNDEFGVREEILDIKETTQEKEFVEKMIEYFVENIEKEEFAQTLSHNQKRFIQFSLDLSAEAYALMYAKLAAEVTFAGKKNNFVRLITQGEELKELLEVILKVSNDRTAKQHII